jgi:hypothetical protein
MRRGAIRSGARAGEKLAMEKKTAPGKNLRRFIVTKVLRGSADLLTGK